MKTFATRKSLYGMATATALSLLIVGPAMAQDVLTNDDSTSATVTAGYLTVSDPNAGVFAGTNVTGVDQTTDATLALFTVGDLTGSGDGWRVSIQASAFDGAIVDNDLAAGSLTMTAPTVDPAAGVSSAEPTVNITTGTVIDNGSVPVATAAVDGGMGTYDFGATTLTVSLPGDVKADVYSSTVTLTVTIPVV